MRKSLLMHGVTGVLVECVMVSSMISVGAAKVHASTMDDRVGLRSDAQAESQSWQKESYRGESTGNAPLGNLRSDIATNARAQPARPLGAQTHRH